jgi:trehalose 2-sulfotransferase
LEPKVRGYVICGEGRSGTNLLAEVATATGKLGVPKEYFHPSFMHRSGDLEYPTLFEHQIQRVFSEGMTSNNVYAFKLFASHVDRLKSFNWSKNFPDLKFVFVQRHDLLMRAISFVRAEQSGKWRSTQETKRPEAYDKHAIREFINTCALADARWQMFFARNGIEPLRLVYEDFVQDQCRKAVADIARLCEVQIAIKLSHTPQHALQRDEVSYEWRDRFIKEHADQSYLDPSIFIKPIRPIKRVLSELNLLRKRIQQR